MNVFLFIISSLVFLASFPMFAYSFVVPEQFAALLFGAGVITSVLPGPGQDGLSPSIGLALVRRQALECDSLQLEDGRQVDLHSAPINFTNQENANSQ